MDWGEVVKSGYAIPEGIQPINMVPELLEMLGSTNPSIRDEQAYGTLANWMRAGHLDSKLREVGDQCAYNLQNSNVLLRSFSALILGEAFRRNRFKPQLLPYIPAIWAECWSRWYSSESDVRSYEEGVGWIHTVAHGANVAREIARRDLGNDGARHLMEDFTERLHSLPIYLNQGEDERIALAMLAVLTQPDFEPSDIRDWLSRYQRLWKSIVPGRITPGAILAVRTLQSLHTLLILKATVDDEILEPAYPQETLEAVQNTLKTIYPYYGSPQDSM